MKKKLKKEKIIKGWLVPWCGRYKKAEFKSITIKGRALSPKEDIDVIPCTIHFKV